MHNKHHHQLEICQQHVLVTVSVLLQKYSIRIEKFSCELLLLDTFRRNDFQGYTSSLWLYIKRVAIHQACESSKKRIVEGYPRRLRGPLSHLARLFACMKLLTPLLSCMNKVYTSSPIRVLNVRLQTDSPVPALTHVHEMRSHRTSSH